MIPLDVTALIEALAPGAPSPGGVVNQVTCDSREAGPGTCFVGLKGRHHDGARFVPEVLEAGAVLALASSTSELTARDDRILRVEDPLQGLADIAAMVRERFSGPVVGITGSVGKTSVKEFLRALLPERLKALLPERSFNNLEGVSRTLTRLEPDTGVLVTELGTNAPGEIAALCRLVRPRLGVLTAIAPAHLEGLGSVEGVLHEKLDLARSLPEGGTLIVNADDVRLRDLEAPAGVRLVRCGLEAREGVTSPTNGDLRRALVLDDGTRLEHVLPLKVQQRNLWIAINVARALGVTSEELAAATPGARPAALRGERRILGPATLVLDCYNANPASMRAALEELGALPGRRAAVVGEMLELGAESEARHRALGEALAALAPDAAIFVGPSGPVVRAGAGAPPWLSIHEDTEAARESFRKLVDGGGTILLKASRGIALERLLETGDG